MRKILLVLAAAVLLYSCSSKETIIKPKEEVKPVVEVPKKVLSFEFEIQKSKINSSLRGISVVDSLTAWASGSNGTFLRTTDGGKTWTSGKVKGFETLDFRDIEAFDKNTALIMSVDAPAFFFKTTDGGKSWKRKYMNRDPHVFFDALAFWDENNGIALSDPIDGRFYIVNTKDGGNSWNEIPSINIPKIFKGESAFAAGGTAISVYGKELVWFGTGGGDKAKIYLSDDAGKNWRAMDAPIKSGSSSGVFSVCFKDDLNGVAVGGDYKNDKDKSSNCVISDDGGLSWQPVNTNQPNGFKSCVVWDKNYKFYFATGTSGSDFSTDDGKTWNSINPQSYNSISISKTDGSCFVVGDHGAIAKVKFSLK